LRNGSFHTLLEQKARFPGSVHELIVTLHDNNSLDAGFVDMSQNLVQWQRYKEIWFYYIWLGIEENVIELFCGADNLHHHFQHSYAFRSEVAIHPEMRSQLQAKLVPAGTNEDCRFLLQSILDRIANCKSLSFCSQRPNA
jgi:hypothetical protein